MDIDIDFVGVWYVVEFHSHLVPGCNSVSLFLGIPLPLLDFYRARFLSRNPIQLLRSSATPCLSMSIVSSSNRASTRKSQLRRLHGVITSPLETGHFHQLFEGGNKEDRLIVMHRKKTKLSRSRNAAGHRKKDLKGYHGNFLSILPFHGHVKLLVKRLLGRTVQALGLVHEY